MLLRDEVCLYSNEMRLNLWFSQQVIKLNADILFLNVLNQVSIFLNVFDFEHVFNLYSTIKQCIYLPVVLDYELHFHLFDQIGDSVTFIKISVSVQTP